MKKLSILILSSVVMLTSCLKDKNIDDQKYGIKGIEDRTLALFPVAKTTTTLDASTKDTTFRILTVSLAEENPSSKDVQVTLEINNALVTAAGFTPAPTTAYSIDNMVVTIPAGKRVGYANITTKTANLASASHAIGFTIKSVSDPKYTISANAKDFIAVLPVKNVYDGKYTVTGTLVDAAVATITAKSPTTMFLITRSGSSVVMYNSGTTVSSWKELFPILNAGAESAYGSFMPVLYFDANNNVIKVENDYGQPAGNTRSAELDPSGVNKYDPATRVIKVKFFMHQPSSVAGAPRAVIDLTMTRTGSR